MAKAIEAVFKGLGELAAQFQAYPRGAVLIVLLVAVVALAAALGMRLR